MLQAAGAGGAGAALLAAGLALAAALLAQQLFLLRVRPAAGWWDGGSLGCWFARACLPARRTTCLCPSVRLSVSVFVSVSACLFCPTVCLSVPVCLCLSVCLSIRLSVCLSDYPSVCLFVCLSVCLSVFLCLSFFLSPNPLSWLAWRGRSSSPRSRLCGTPPARPRVPPATAA